MVLSEKLSLDGSAHLGTVHSTECMGAKVWSIAGSDNSCGAGIQADNKVFDRFNVQAGNIITAVTAQNAQGVHASHINSKRLLDEQWKALAQDGMADVLKLGMLASSDIVEWLVNKLRFNAGLKVVCDPVLTASSGGGLIDKVQAYLTLLPHISVLTPNQDEFAKIFSLSFQSLAELEGLALDVAKKYDIDIVITGGESLLDANPTEAIDVCVVSGQRFLLTSPLQKTQATHGTGCAFASSIAASLALGYSTFEAITLAKAYLNQGLLKTNQSHSSQRNFLHTRFPHSIESLPSVLNFSSPRLAPVFPKIDGQLGLYPVVDSVAWLEKCLKSGVRTIQLRVKDDGSKDFTGCVEAMVAKAVELSRLYDAKLFINDYWQLAIKYQAFGVHLGQEDLATANIHAIQEAGLHLGVSTHSWFEIARAHSLQPSYIAIGPIYATTTKEMPWVPQGLDKLALWCRLLESQYPIVAIGGINLDNADEVLSTGVGSIAMVRAITDAEDYQVAIQQLQKKIDTKRVKRI